MSVTKKSKKINLKLFEVATYYAEYRCPSCFVEFRGARINESVIKFKCSSCGQVLIIESVIKIPSKREVEKL